MGEDHHIPTHKLLQQAVLGSCLDAGIRPSYGIEFPDDIYKTLAKNVYGRTEGAKFFKKAKLKDIDGSMSLRGHLRYYVSDTAPETLRSNFLFCLEKNISVQFNDLARVNYNGKRVLDLSDDFIKKNMGKGSCQHHQIPDSEIEETSSIGMAYRNQGLLENSIRQWEMQKPDVLIHFQGGEHVFGNSILGLQYKDSLSAQFYQAKWRVLNVIPLRQAGDPLSVYSIPPDAKMDNTIFISQQDESTYFFNSVFGGENLNAEKERRFIRTVCDESGGIIDSPILTSVQMHRMAQEYRDFDRSVMEAVFFHS